MIFVCREKEWFGLSNEVKIDSRSRFFSWQGSEYIQRMCINIILFKMDSIKRQLGVLPEGRSSLLLLYGVLVIMALTPGGSVQGYSVQKRGEPF